MLLLKVLLILDASTGQAPEQAVIVHDSSFHRFQAHTEQEQCDELEAHADDKNQDSPLQLLRGDEIVILAGQVEQAEVDDCDLNNQR